MERLELKQLKKKKKVKGLMQKLKYFFPKRVYVFYPTLGIFEKEMEIGQYLQPSAEKKVKQRDVTSLHQGQGASVNELLEPTLESPVKHFEAYSGLNG